MYENYRIDPRHITYGRRDSWLNVGLIAEGTKVGEQACIMALGAEARGMSPNPAKFYALPIELLRDGESVSYSLEITPVFARLRCEYGEARFCIADKDTLRVSASGVDVRFRPKMTAHEVAKDRGDGTLEICFSSGRAMLLPLYGTMEMTGSYDAVASLMRDFSATFRRGADGTLDAAVHYYISSRVPDAVYPPFADCVAAVDAEFAAYMDTMPRLPSEYEADRVTAAYLVWSDIMEIDGTEFVFMNKGIHRGAFSWQQAQHAIAQYNQPRLAWTLLNNMFRYQDECGALPDAVTSVMPVYSGCKPPIQGLALQYLSRRTDWSFVPNSEMAESYTHLCRLADWWLSLRDSDNDFALQYDAADESGWDDSSMFRIGGPLEAPDLMAYLILLMEQLSDMAARLGNSFESRAWRTRSQRMLELLLRDFWDGEEFVACLSGSHEKVRCGSLAMFIPLILGKRLPQEIVDTLCGRLMEEGRWLSPYGLAGEDMTGGAWLPYGWLAGPVLAPANYILFLALQECGRDDLAREIARRYCKAVHDTGFAMIINSKTGEDVSELRWQSSNLNRMSWTGMAFLMLGSALA